MMRAIPTRRAEDLSIRTLIGEIRLESMAEDNTLNAVANMILLAKGIQKGETPKLSQTELACFKVATEGVIGSSHKISKYPGMIRILEQSYAVVYDYMRRQ